MEEIRTFEGLALEELEAQTLDLLPDREEMQNCNLNAFSCNQSNKAFQYANAQNFGGAFNTAAAANVALQSNNIS